MSVAEPLEPRCLLAGAPLSAVPVLNSRPSAFAQLVLDFDGDAADTWNFGGGTYNVPVTPAYTTDSDRQTFSDTELDNIRRIFTIVAEKYSPFNINVTTVDPGTLDDKHVQKVVIGGNGNWVGEEDGGIGTFGGFAGPASNKVYVFSDRSGGDPNIVAVAAAHEAGHGFGLSHQSKYDANDNFLDEYNPGTAAVSPIMGFNPTSARQLWWHGLNSLGVYQDDADVIASVRNGFGYRTDDHGFVAPMTRDGPLQLASGVIEKASDFDGFVFTNNGADSVGIRVNVAAVGTMLDARFEVRTNSDTNYSVLAVADGATLNETLANLPLDKGTYRLVVSGTQASAGVLGLGDALGTYNVRVMTASTSDTEYTVEAGKSVTLSTSGPLSLNYRWDLDGDGIFGESGSSAKNGNEIGRIVTFQSGSLAPGTEQQARLRVTDGSITSFATATVSVTAPAPANPQPAEWAKTDIGAVGIPGNVTANDPESLTIKAAGSNINSTADSFTFVSRTIDSDGQLIAKLDSFSAGQSWAKAGVMIRDGTAPDARYALVYVTPSVGTYFATRETPGGETWTAKPITGKAPRWIKLVRNGDTFSGYVSADGATWQLLGSRTFDTGTGSLRAGLAVTSKQPNALATASFSHVSFLPPSFAIPSHPLVATEDTYTRDGSFTDTNFGDDTTLGVKRSASGYNRVAYVLFDVATLSAVGSAILRLHGHTDGGNVRVSVASVPTTTWSETAITWKDRPASGATLGTTVVGAANGWYTWDVTSYVKSQLAAGKTKIAFAINGADSTAAVTTFDSSETTSGPQLAVS